MGNVLKAYERPRGNYGNVNDLRNSFAVGKECMIDCTFKARDCEDGHYQNSYSEYHHHSGHGVSGGFSAQIAKKRNNDDPCCCKEKLS